LGVRAFRCVPVVFFILIGLISFSVFPTDVVAQQSPEDCDPNQVFQLGICQDIDEPGTAPFILETDQPSYDDGDIIRISGIITNLNEDFVQPVTIVIVDPGGNIVKVNQAYPDFSGAFSFSLEAGGAMKTTGYYVIKAQYGAQKSSITFYFQSSVQQPSDCGPNQVFQLGICQDIDEGGYVVLEIYPVPFDNTANDMVTLSFTAKSDALKGTTMTSMVIDHLDYKVIISKDGNEIWSDQFHDHDGNLELQITPSEGRFTKTVGQEVGTSETKAFMIKGPVFLDSGNYQITSQIVGIEFNPLRTPLTDYFNIRVIGGGDGGTIFDTVPPLILVPSDITIDANDSSGARVDYSVKAIDDEDGVLRPNCSPSSGSLFPIGKTTVTCSATDNSGNSDKKSFVITVNVSDVLIPSWIKDVAGFWCDDEIDNASFIEAIQYLINNDVIIVPATTSSGSGSQEIPNWVKNNACWWSQGLITNSDFASGLQYLVGQGIIQV